VQAHPPAELGAREGGDRGIGLERFDPLRDTRQRVAVQAPVRADVDRGAAGSHHIAQRKQLGLAPPRLFGDLVGKIEPARQQELQAVLDEQAFGAGGIPGFPLHA
jgi:hypothetical protein